jgi:RNA polymerase sigma factor (sigma-70 family)
VNNDEDAEDILQDVWYQLSAIVDTEPIEKMSSWLYRVSRNRIIDKKRKQKQLSLEDFAYEDEDGEIVFPDSLLEDEITPEDEFDRAFLKESFFKAISNLPEKQRQVFVMNEIENYTLQEIADITGDNLKTIISRKRYAVAQLRLQLKNLYNEYY